jgi:two-component system alkaline phosphatase synthesis response regulator PhoP
MRGKILLIEDEELIGTMLELNLRQEGYEVIWFKAGRPVLAGDHAAACDLIILDIMLPDMSGVDILRRLREQAVHTPVLMLTAKADLETKVASLHIGADDYVTKPFDLPELLARAWALIRRSQGRRQLPSGERLRIGTCTVDLANRTAHTRAGDVQLSPKESELLSLFARNPGRTLSRAEILEEVWGMDVSVTERTVDNFIVRFRKLFEPDIERPAHFITVRGMGYRLEP